MYLLWFLSIFCIGPVANVLSTQTKNIVYSQTILLKCPLACEGTAIHKVLSPPANNFFLSSCGPDSTSFRSARQKKISAWFRKNKKLGWLATVDLVALCVDVVGISFFSAKGVINLKNKPRYKYHDSRPYTAHLRNFADLFARKWVALVHSPS